jgi:hypothetical protein
MPETRTTIILLVAITANVRDANDCVVDYYPPRPKTITLLTQR